MIGNGSAVQSLRLPFVTGGECTWSHDVPALPARVLGKTDTKVGWALSVPDPLARHQIVGCSSAKSGPIISNDV